MLIGKKPMLIFASKMEDRKKVIVVGARPAPEIYERLSREMEDSGVHVINCDEEGIPGLPDQEMREAQFLIKNYAQMGMMNPPVPKALRGKKVIPVRNSKTDPKIQRNDPCPCSSGKKYKQCCMNKKSV